MIGLLWADWSKTKSMVDVVKDAARRYEQKFGYAPTEAHVNETVDVLAVDGLQIVKRKDVAKHQVWVTGNASAKVV